MSDATPPPVPPTPPTGSAPGAPAGQPVGLGGPGELTLPTGGRFVKGMLAGGLIVALVGGGVWGVVAATQSASTPPGATQPTETGEPTVPVEPTSPVAPGRLSPLPEQVGDEYRPTTVITEEISGEARPLYFDVASITERVQSAYGGAPAEVQQYSRDDLMVFLTVVAVAAPSPDLWVLEITPEEALADPRGKVYPRQHVVEQDGVQCVLSTTMTPPPGEEPAPEDIPPTLCKISDDSVSVYVYIGGGQNIGLDGAVEFMNDLKAELL